jgi:predicted permease
MVGDLKYSVRRLLRDSEFTTVALLTLALCIGANTAIFSLVYALILKPLPFPTPNRIVQIYNQFPKDGFDKFPSNVVQYTDFKAHATCFAAIGLWQQNTLTVGEPGSMDRIQEADCTADMFDVLGLKPVVGRFFTPENSRKGNEMVLVLSESFWKSHYNDDPEVLGKTIRVEGEAYQIVGVAPKTMETFCAQARFFRPVAWKPEDVVPQMRYSCSLDMYARLNAGETPSGALGRVLALERNYYDSAGSGTRRFLDQSGHTMGIGTLQFERVAPIKSALLLLQGGVLVVLLIGCGNVANLLLVRANRQQGDLAIRVGLGASGATIARQLLIESLVVTVTGGILSVTVACGSVSLVDRYLSVLLPDTPPIGINVPALVYTAAASIIVGLLTGLAPVIHVLGSAPATLINRSSRSMSGSRGVRAMSGMLVSGQVAVTLVLLSGAGLLIHSFVNALSIDPGFDPKHLVEGSIALPIAYQAKSQSAPLQERLERVLKEIPGIDGSALANGVPFKGGLPILTLTLKENDPQRSSDQPGAFLVGVSVEYFRTLRISLLGGRLFEEADWKKPGGVFVVDQGFEQKYFPGRSAVGCHFTFGGPPSKETDWPEIIGVVRNVPHNGLDDRSGNAFVYYTLGATSLDGVDIFIRSGRPIGDLVVAARDKLRAIDPSILLFATGSMQQVIDDSLSNRRVLMTLVGAFAGLALFLSAVGIYGVLAYDVSQRTREIGIRSAIGASRRQIIGLVVRQGLWRTAIGMIVGAASAAILNRCLVSLLFELKPTDPWAYLAVGLLLLIVALTASYLPARRASRVDPVEALRYE